MGTDECEVEVLGLRERYESDMGYQTISGSKL